MCSELCRGENASGQAETLWTHMGSAKAPEAGAHAEGDELGEVRPGHTSSSLCLSACNSGVTRRSWALLNDLVASCWWQLHLLSEKFLGSAQEFDSPAPQL